ncbi:MAG: hypothetical protein IJS88_06395 [Alphaproteobacteria bacterium]|nr:hypothetical protein [Alphaproteobacteria bacterium]
MIYVLSWAELFTVVALVVFGTVLHNHRYEQVPINICDRLICYAMILYVAAAFLTALPLVRAEWNYQNIAIITAHTAYHFVVGVFLLFALVKFADVPFRYEKSHLLARGALYFAFVFEALALCAFVVCCVLVF